MSKHPHRLILQQRKTWRCTLEGCSFFVHTGLAHILLGKQGVCWECGEVFTLDETALQDEMPVCMDCRALRLSTPEVVEEVITETPVETNGREEIRRTMEKMLGTFPSKKGK